MKKKTLKFLIFLSLSVFSVNTYANTGEIEYNSANSTTETISSLKGDLEDLKNEESGLNYKLDLLKEEGELKDFFKDNLNLLEIEEIKNIIIQYRENNIELNIILDEKSKNLEDISEIRKEIISKRIEFYKNLVPYIDKEKLEEYKSYIKSDTEILRDKKEVNAEINRKEELLKNRVEDIKEKIEEHRTLLDEKLQKVIETKLQEKIENLKNNEKFKILSIELKRKVIEESIKKIEYKIIALENIENRTNIILKKIEIYNLAIEKIKELLDIY